MPSGNVRLVLPTTEVSVVVLSVRVYVIAKDGIDDAVKTIYISLSFPVSVHFISIFVFNFHKPMRSLVQI